MKRVLLMSSVGLLTVGLLAGCGQRPEPILFEGKKLTTEQVSEILENRIEEENGIEFEVELYEEVED